MNNRKRTAAVAGLYIVTIVVWFGQFEVELGEIKILDVGVAGLSLQAV